MREPPLTWIIGTMLKTFIESFWLQLAALALLVVYIDLRDGPAVHGGWKRALQEVAAGIVFWGLLFALVTQGHGCGGPRWSEPEDEPPAVGK